MTSRRVHSPPGRKTLRQTTKVAFFSFVIITSTSRCRTRATATARLCKFLTVKKKQHQARWVEKKRQTSKNGQRSRESSDVGITVTQRHQTGRGRRGTVSSPEENRWKPSDHCWRQQTVLGFLGCQDFYSASTTLHLGNRQQLKFVIKLRN